MMIPNIAVQEIHDTLPNRRSTDFETLWHKRGERLAKLATDLEEMTRQRDMLATRCAEQARQIAAMAAPFAPQAEHTAFDAIAAMQRAGIR